MKRAATAALLCTILLALYGCRAIKSIEVPVYIHDTTLVRQHVHDSTYIDRWHTEYVNGDTVHVRDSIRFTKYVDRHDTTYVSKEVPVKVKETVEVEKKVYVWWLPLLLIGITFGLAVHIWLNRLEKKDEDDRE